MLQASRGQVGGMHEQHVAPPEHAAVAVVQRIDGGVVLVMAADRHQTQHVVAMDLPVFVQAFEHVELGLARGRFPFALGRRQRHAEAARHPHTLVEILEAGHGLLDQLADAVVVRHQFQPWHLAVRQGRGGDACHDGGLGAQQRGGRRQLAGRGMHHRHRVLHRHRLRSGLLDIELGAAQARQHVSLLRHQQVRAVELGPDMHAQVELAHCREALLGIGQGHGKVAAQAKQRPGPAIDHRLHGIDGVVPVPRRRPEAEGILEPPQEVRRRLLGDADGTVPLHVGVAAQGADAGARLAEVAAQHQQVAQQADIGGAFVVLGHAHAVGHDGGVRPGVSRCNQFEILAAEAAGLLDIRPLRRAQVIGQCVEALGMGGDERMVQHIALARFPLQQRLHHALDGGRVAPGPDLEVGRGNPGGTVGRHLHQALRVREAFQRALAQRVEHDDRHLAPRGLVQRAHHARVVRAGVMADRDDQFALVEIFQRHRALADADRARQAHAGGLVAHVRAVREIVGAVFAREQLVQVGGLVRSPAGGVELHLLRPQAAQDLADTRERGFPLHRPEGVGGPVIDQRMRQAALVFQFVVGAVQQRRYRIGGEELRRHALGRGFPGHGLGAVLAELEGRPVFLVGPRAARAVEAVGLVGAQQRDRGLDGIHLQPDRGGGRLQGSPASGGAVVFADTGYVA
ncbi:hypothetical protein D9M72_343990 [compost metagenome]